MDPFRDGAIAALDDGVVESVWLSEQLGRPIVKAWNAVLSYTLAHSGKPQGAEGRLAAPVAGDDPAHKALAIQLVDATGFDAVDAGPLSESWRQQPGTPAYCTELTLPELRDALAAADKARAPVDRDALIKSFMEEKSPLSHEQIVARNREVTAPR